MLALAGPETVFSRSMALRGCKSPGKSMMPKPSRSKYTEFADPNNFAMSFEPVPAFDLDADTGKQRHEGPAGRIECDPRRRAFKRRGGPKDLALELDDVHSPVAALEGIAVHRAPLLPHRSGGLFGRQDDDFPALRCREHEIAGSDFLCGGGHG